MVWHNIDIEVAPLQKYGELKRDRTYKAEILNDQFKLLFTLYKENNSSMEGLKCPTVGNLIV